MMGSEGISRELETEGDTFIVAIGMNENLPKKQELLKIRELIENSVKNNIAVTPQVRTVENMSSTEKGLIGEKSSYMIKTIVQMPHGREISCVGQDRIEASIIATLKSAGYDMTKTAKIVI